MRWITCEDCGSLINSDNDPECFVYVGNYKRQHAERVLCEVCRMDFYAECERMQEEANAAE
jgi:hypothetical protein